MIDLEEQIVAFVAQQTGVKRKRVQLASRLAQDIGMDGDDTVACLAEEGCLEVSTIQAGRPMKSCSGWPSAPLFQPCGGRLRVFGPSQPSKSALPPPR
jgi:hypothetical protein